MAKKTDKFNVFLADLAVMNIKVHNLHWNVVGYQFKAVHKMTEKIYMMFQHQFDEFAETMKMQNLMPQASMADYLENTTIDEIESRDYTVEEVLEELSVDCEKIMKSAKELRDEADKKDNFQIANLMEDYLNVYAKHAWMLRAMQGEDTGEFEEDQEDEDK